MAAYFNSKNSDAHKAKQKKQNFYLACVAAILVVLILSDKIPNPLDRFWELDAGSYRNLTRALDAVDSPRLQLTIKAALDRDGKLTQHNTASVWEAFNKTIPAGYRIEGNSQELGRGAARQQLIERVDAHPVNVVWTPFTD